MATTYQPSQWLMPENSNQDKVGNYSFDCDGVDEYIDCGQVSAFDSATAMSISGWFKQDALDIVAYMCGTYVASDDCFTIYTWNDGSMYVHVGNGLFSWANFDYSTVVTANQWFHMAIVFDGTFTDGDPATQNAGRVKCYINNSPITLSFNDDAPSALNAVNSDFYIGSVATKTASDCWNGLISEVSVFNYALTAGNVATLYGSAGTGVGNPMGLDVVPVGYWKGDKAGLGDQWAVPNQVGDGDGALYSEYSFEFDGTTDWFTFPDIAFLKGGGDYVSISVWVQATGGTQLGFWSCRSATPDQMNLWRQTDNTLSFDILSSVAGDISVRTDAAAINDDTWYNIVATFDGTEGSASDRIKVYVNGVAPAQTVTGTGTNLPQGGVTVVNYIGRTFLGIDHLGYESNVAIWDSTLTAANALTIYNSGKPADLTSLSPVAWWKLGNEAFWNGSTWIILDQIGSNDATGVGVPNLVGEAPQSFANGLSVSMDIDDRIGESGFSDNNALSYNMDSEARKADVAPTP